MGAPFLGAVPLLLDIRTNADAGTPVVAAAPDSDAAKAFVELAGAVWAQVERKLAAPVAGPRIVIT